MFIWNNFYKNIQQDIKLLLYMLGVFCLFRVSFIVLMKSYISAAATMNDYGMALYYGLRISLKSAGLMVLTSFILCTLCCSLLHGCVKSQKLKRLRFILGTIYVFVLSVLFYARIPYYEQFHMAFNQLLFNTFKDDTTALFYTLVQQYDLPIRLLMATVTTWALSKLLKIWLATRTYHVPRFTKAYQNIAFRVGMLIAIYYFSIFLRFGGAMSYGYNVDWENAGITKDELLNEAILDDVQALYRAYALHERLVNSTGLALNPDKITEYAENVAGREVGSATIDDYMERTADGPLIPRPKHVFLIVSESYANWPLLPEYKDLNLANGMKSIIAKPNAAYVKTFLPNGMATIAGVMGVVTGLAEVNLYANYLPESYKEPYATALAPQFEKLGYHTDFWYAGPASWERIQDFTLAQGFDEFHGIGDFKDIESNIWGCDDKYLYRAVAENIKNQPGLHMILNTANHSPYSVDLQREGFDESIVTGGLPDSQKNDKELIKKLGHHWYADKTMTDFINSMQAKYPDSLFVVVADHADRLNIEASPRMYERYGIPFIIYGKGVTKNIFPEDAAGSHINITATLLEMIAPKGFTYYSLGESLTRGSSLGMNYNFWINSGFIGRTDSNVVEALQKENDTGDKPSYEDVKDEIESLRAVSWWREKYGKIMKKGSEAVD
ncbi:MAG: sulfatase-like hydrolase/transferase [Pelosinus sp.]|nr:sulfatase-like hydrolase/transferase [Pelosinus sp.]